MTIIIDDKYLAWEIEEVSRLYPDKYPNMAEFVRVALTREVNKNRKYQLSQINSGL